MGVSLKQINLIASVMNGMAEFYRCLGMEMTAPSRRVGAAPPEHCR